MTSRPSIKKRSQGGVSPSRGALPNPFCSTVNSQDPDQRAAIKEEYDQLMNQNHDSLGAIAAAAPDCSSDNFVSQHARPQTGHLITCQKCGTESENGSTICGNCFHFIVYKFDGGQPQSLTVSFFNEQRGVEQVELKVISGKLNGHRSNRKSECDRLDQHCRKAMKRGYKHPLERMQYHLNCDKGDTEQLIARWKDSEWYYRNINDSMGDYFDPYSWNYSEDTYRLVRDIGEFSDLCVYRHENP